MFSIYNQYTYSIVRVSMIYPPLFVVDKRLLAQFSKVVCPYMDSGCRYSRGNRCGRRSCHKVIRYVTVNYVGDISLV